MQAEIWTSTYCPFCIRAKALLEEKGIPYTEHVMDGKFAELDEVKRCFGHPTVPIILLDEEFIGGCDELMELEAAGRLDT